jgi:hypothetical protein
MVMRDRGNAAVARIATMDITTRSSIKVMPRDGLIGNLKLEIGNWKFRISSPVNPANLKSSIFNLRPALALPHS